MRKSLDRDKPMSKSKTKCETSLALHASMPRAPVPRKSSLLVY